MNIADGLIVAVMGRLGWINGVVLAAYLLALTGLGVWFSRRERSTDDYFRAGRRVPWWAAGLSIFGTGLSAITYMAIPAKAFATDWVYILGAFAPILFIPIVVRYYIPFYRRLDVTTPYEYLERRFNLPARLLASGFYIAFQFARMSLVLYLPAVALHAVSDLDVVTCVVVMGGLATLYTVLGGIEAVIWTDVLQVVVLIGGAVVCLAWVAVDAGGIGPVIRIGAQFDKFHTFDFSPSLVKNTFWVMVAGNFFSAVMPNTADQAIVQRYLTTPDVTAAKRAAWTSALLGIPMHFVFYFLGTSLFVFYHRHPQLLPADVQTDAILPFFVVQQLPAGLSGLIIAGAFAAAMSSADSGMNAIATTVCTDWVARFARGLGDRNRLWVARGVTLLAGGLGTALAVVLALSDIQSVVDAFMTALNLFGGTLGGLFVLGIFFPSVHGRGALVGAGVSVGGVWFVRTQTDLNFFLYAAVGLSSCVVAGWLASQLLPGQPRDLTIHSVQ